MRLRFGCLVSPLFLALSFTACGDEGYEEEGATLDGGPSPIADAAPLMGGDAGPPADEGEAGAGLLRDAASPVGEPPDEAGSTVGEEGGVLLRDAGGAGRRPDAAVADAGHGGSGDASAASDASMGACPGRGSLRYTLQEKSAPSSAESAAYAKIRMAMDKAVEKYNCYTSLSREVRVSYDPAVATADGNPNGNIRFGSEASMHFVTAMHELGHVFGVGAPQYKPLVRNGVFTGPLATAALRRLTGDPAASLKSDGTHFWPYGLNYVNEYKTESDLINHCAIVVAIRADLGM